MLRDMRYCWACCGVGMLVPTVWRRCGWVTLWMRSRVAEHFSTQACTVEMGGGCGLARVMPMSVTAGSMPLSEARECEG